jgi:hypothetical protein
MQIEKTMPYEDRGRKQAWCFMFIIPAFTGGKRHGDLCPRLAQAKA